MIVTASNISYVGKNKKAIIVSNLTVDGYQFGTRCMDIETNIFAKMVLEYAKANNIEIKDEYPDIIGVGQFADQREMQLEQFKSIIETYIRTKPQERGYDDASTLVSYMFSSKEKYKKEATNYIEWRDHAYDEFHAVINEFNGNDEYSLPTIAEMVERIGPIDWDK